VKNMFSVKKLRSKLLYVQQDLYSSSSSSSDSENDLEHFECATCGVIVKNRPLSRFCLSCENKRRKIKEEKILSSIPQLEPESEIKKTLQEQVQYMTTASYDARKVLGRVIVLYIAQRTANKDFASNVNSLLICLNKLCFEWLLTCKQRFCVKRKL
jgi:hypothetical protein